MFIFLLISLHAKEYSLIAFDIAITEAALFEVYRDKRIERILGLFGQNGSKLCLVIIYLLFLQALEATNSA